MRPFSALRIAAAALTLTVGFTAAPAAHAEDIEAVEQPTSKNEKLRKLQIINRAFQVCYGRGIKPDEASRFVKMSKIQIIRALIESEEMSSVYADRLQAFAAGGDVAARPREASATSEIRALAKPTDKLDQVLGKVKTKRHDGEKCGDDNNTVCFAGWLVQRVAPSLGAEWVKANAGEMSGWSYARLLEQITTSSL